MSETFFRVTPLSLPRSSSGLMGFMSPERPRGLTKLSLSCRRTMRKRRWPQHLLTFLVAGGSGRPGR